MLCAPALVIFFLLGQICISAKNNRDDNKWNIPLGGDDDEIPPYKGRVDEKTDMMMMKKQRIFRNGKQPPMPKPKQGIRGGKIDERKKMFDPDLDIDVGPILDDLRNEIGGRRCAIKHNKGETMLPERINKNNENLKQRQSSRKLNDKTKKGYKRFRKLPTLRSKNDIQPKVDPNFFVKIPLKLHIIYCRFGGWINGSTITTIMNRLNKAYAGVLGKVVGPDTGIRFVLDEVTRTDDMKMFFYCDYYFKELKAKFIVQPEKYINVITCDPYHDAAGWSSFPFEGPENSSIHGMVLHHEALSGSVRFPQWSRGMTLVHEIGHYLGLYHTFHNEKCHNALNPEEDDGVIDTPPEASPARSCDDIGRDTCTGPGESLPTVPPYRGIDPVTNYMNYIEDKCMEQFTIGQAEMLQESIKEFKPTICGKTKCQIKKKRLKKKKPRKS